MLKSLNALSGRLHELHEESMYRFMDLIQTPRGQQSRGTGSQRMRPSSLAQEDRFFSMPAMLFGSRN